MKTLSFTLGFLLFFFSYPGWAEPRPATDGARYQKAMVRFHQYREAKRHQIKNDDNLPFLMTHGSRSDNTALLIHGYADSPVIMRRTGEILHSLGFNVVGVLLHGHGTRIEELETVRMADWDRDVMTGFAIAQGLGKKLLVAGFSTGGVYSLRLAIERPRDVHGIIALAPALKIAIPFADFACHWKSPREQLPRHEAIARDLLAPVLGLGKYIPEDDPIRYRKIPIPGICELIKLQRKVVPRMNEVAAPLLTVASEADGLLDYREIERLSRQVRGESYFYAFPWYQGVIHIHVPTPETNPYFANLEPALEAFARKHFLLN